MYILASDLFKKIKKYICIILSWNLKIRNKKIDWNIYIFDSNLFWQMQLMKLLKVKNSWKITFLICVLVLWIHKGYCLVKELVWNVRIKGFGYTKIFTTFKIKSECVLCMSLLSLSKVIRDKNNNFILIYVQPGLKQGLWRKSSLF